MTFYILKKHILDSINEKGTIDECLKLEMIYQLKQINNKLKKIIENEYN